MKRVPAMESISPENELNFERERLLNLIDCKVKRKDMEIAMNLADELFRAEMEFALMRKTRQLKKYNALILRIIFLMLTVLFAAMTFMVMNINPSFNLLVQAVAMLSIISSVVVNAILINRFTKTVAMMMDAYEVEKQTFIQKLLDNLINCGNSKVKYQTLFPK